MTAKRKREQKPRESAGKREHDQGIVQDGLAQEQPRDPARASHVSRVNRGDDPPGRKPSRQE